MSTEFKQMNTEDLNKSLKEKREKLLNTRFSLSGGKTRKSAETKALKREIAQIMTVLKTSK